MNIFVLFGQTATGKTAKALELADKYNGEIINFDSRQIYKKLDIITGKDRPSNSKYKIWLYDIADPKDIFSSAEYVKNAENCIKDICSRGKTPILVGGTGYYLRHLLFGIPEITVKENWRLRKQLENKTTKELQGLLIKLNKALFEQMNNSDGNNPRRLIRRIEIAKQGGQLLPPSMEVTLGTRLNIPIDMHYSAFFHPSTDIARERISLRVENRLAQGAIEEMKNLLNEGYTKNDPGLKTIGYQQLIAYLEGKMTMEEAKNSWINKEVQYAKRQKTYFKKYFKG